MDVGKGCCRKSLKRPGFRVCRFTKYRLCVPGRSVAHQRCAGHPVSDDAHVGDVAKTADALKRETGFMGRVAAMVAEYRSDLNWNVKTVMQI